ncbi:MAG: PD-(D/E)XK nuclease family protein [Anaerolineae bacterium]|nr:PD-(D/E)XK nuclease family protein [Thermoflexales bacterium]MDW8396477.1 PD-(D/E)XK nuclease family protein [Anaerolineae bacterium]
MPRSSYTPTIAATAVLPLGFTFSQHSLNDFKDCPRRFYLKYVARQPWPLVEVSPLALDALQYREDLQRGARFHRWVERYWLGLPEPPHLGDETLARWWARFTQTDFSDLPPVRLPEVELVAALGEHNLYARFDLLALTPPEAAPMRAVIVDWKTLHHPEALPFTFYKNRVQTRVYLYVLATAGSAFTEGRPLEPAQCSLRYWLANHPDTPWVEITYSREEYERDRYQLGALIDSILARQHEADFEMTADERHCTYCTFRTLCQRAGDPSAPPPDEDEALLMPDLDTVPELEY